MSTLHTFIGGPLTSTRLKKTPSWFVINPPPEAVIEACRYSLVREIRVFSLTRVCPCAPTPERALQPNHSGMQKQNKRFQYVEAWNPSSSSIGAAGWYEKTGVSRLYIYIGGRCEQEENRSVNRSTNVVTSSNRDMLGGEKSGRGEEDDHRSGKADTAGRSSSIHTWTDAYNEQVIIIKLVDRRILVIGFVLHLATDHLMAIGSNSVIWKTRMKTMKKRTMISDM
ncbi:hypothetical protein H4Q26_014068 [Puccinia striiformis f. sp. tritici PST-130]|nr:hypothetical protein H4Q26_014068 [Puccinia striiformis f. sp. tritici PST-130]